MPVLAPMQDGQVSLNMNRENTHIVIMAGGIGSRLWPLSTPEHPKQFIDVLGLGKSLLRLTAERFLPLAPFSNFWVVTGERYAKIVAEHLPEIPADHILSEPEPRNTAPCIAYACRKIALRYPDANIVVTPSDAIVTKTELFAEVISKALDETEHSDSIVTVGITPTRPETGYGYIHASSKEKEKVIPVSEFREKPNLETAEKYLADGSYVWNAGIFVWNVSTIIAELSAHAPSVMEVMDKMAPSFYTPGEMDALRRLFPTCEKISIDYAVMEKSSHIKTIAAELGWSDLGGWSSVREHIRQDAEGNAVVGDGVRLFGCSGCIVHVPSGRKTVLSGLRDSIVCEAGGGIIVCPLSDEQNIREYSK